MGDDFNRKMEEKAGRARMNGGGTTW
jgi:hypothetical protein